VSAAKAKKGKKRKLFDKDSEQFHRDLLDNEDAVIAGVHEIMTQEKAGMKK
jgi:hypothetical protein